ncbi:hypothetical protein HDV02_002797 [Globomyces sp. JEL0801]|nr:hypothetical protein HDV02_002797 [Globomyces sp. JEL0801]
MFNIIPYPNQGFPTNMTRVQVPLPPKPRKTTKPPNKSVTNQRHWMTSKYIDSGLNLSHTQSEKSMINYPSLNVPKKRCSPKLSPIKKIDEDVQQIIDKLKSHQSLVRIHTAGFGPLANIPSTHTSTHSELINLPTLIDQPNLKEDKIMNQNWLMYQKQELDRLVNTHLTTKVFINLNYNSKLVRIPLDILYQSSTIKHIHQSSNQYLEYRNGLTFPTIPDTIMEIILNYLSRQFLTYQNVDTSMLIPFDFDQEINFHILEIANFLDIPQLVDFCISKAAKDIYMIGSFGNLPNSIIRKILKLLNIGELVQIEHEVLKYDNLEVKLNDKISIGSVWIDKFFKVMHNCKNRFPSEFPSRLYQMVYQGTIINLSKSVAIDFFLSQFLLKAAKSTRFPIHLMESIINYEGNRVNELVLHFDTDCSQQLNYRFWCFILQKCANIQLITVNCSVVNSCLSNFLLAACESLPKIVVKINFIIPESFSIVSQIAPYMIFPKKDDIFIRKNARSNIKNRHLHMKTENTFNLKGISSLAEYLDLPESQQEQESTETTQKLKFSEISISFSSESKPSQNLYKENFDFYKIQSELYIPYITILDFSNFNFGFNGALDLSNFLKNNQTTLCVTNLNLNNSNITSIGLNLVLNALVDSKVPLAPKLKKLKLSRLILDKNFDDTEYIKYLAYNLNNFTSLLEFDFSFNAITNLCVKYLTESIAMTKILNLNLSGIHLMIYFSNVVNWFKGRTSVTLNISNCELNQKNFLSLTNETKSDTFANLDVSSNLLDHIVVPEFQKVFILSRVVQVNLSNTNINQDDVLNLLKGLKYLKNVDLSYLRLKDNFMTEIGCRLSKGKLWNIQRWNLTYNDITSTGVLSCVKKAKVYYQIIKKVILMELDHNSIHEEFIQRYQRDVAFGGFEGVFAYFSRHAFSD